MKKLFTATFSLLFIFASLAFGDAPFIVRDKEIKFVNWVYTLSQPLTDKEKVMELRQAPCIMASNTKLWVLETVDKALVQSKLTELGLSASSAATVITSTQTAKKAELDGKYWTKSEVIAAGMPNAN